MIQCSRPEDHWTMSWSAKPGLRKTTCIWKPRQHWSSLVSHWRIACVRLDLPFHHYHLALAASPWNLVFCFPKSWRIVDASVGPSTTGFYLIQGRNVAASISSGVSRKTLMFLTSMLISWLRIFIFIRSRWLRENNVSSPWYNFLNNVPSCNNIMEAFFKPQ